MLEFIYWNRQDLDRQTPLLPVGNNLREMGMCKEARRFLLDSSSSGYISVTLDLIESVNQIADVDWWVLEELLRSDSADWGMLDSVDALIDWEGRLQPAVRQEYLSLLESRMGLQATPWSVYRDSVPNLDPVARCQLVKMLIMLKQREEKENSHV